MTPRATLWAAVVLAEGVAFLAAVRHERRLHVAPRFPVTALLVVALVIDLVVAIEDPPFAWGLAAISASGPRPRHGLVLLAYHAADALVMSWPVALAWTCLRAFRPPPHPLTLAGKPLRGAQKTNGPDISEPSCVREPGANTIVAALERSCCRGSRPLGPADRSDAVTRQGIASRDPNVNGSSRTLPLAFLAAVYLGALAVLVVGHPLGGTWTRRVLLAVELVALAVAGAAIVAGWRRAVAGRATWTRSHGALLVLVPVELAVAVIGPFARPDVFSSWNVARGQYLIAFVLVAALLAWPRRSTARR